MARTLVATALATCVVAVVAMVMGKHQDPATSVPELLGLTAMFCAGWLLASYLFRRAAVAA